MQSEQKQLTTFISNDLNEKLEEWSNYGGGKIKKKITNEALKLFFNTYTKEEWITPKPKFEDTHTRFSFTLHDDLRENLNKFVKQGGKGNKTQIVNAALEAFFHKHRFME